MTKLRIGDMSCPHCMVVIERDAGTQALLAAVREKGYEARAA